MTPQTNTGWSISSLLSMSAVAYAVGVATSDSVQSGFKRVSSHNIRAFFGAPPALELLHKLPSQAQVVDPASFAVIPGVPPPSVANISTNFIPPGFTLDGMKAKPFHIYHPDFMAIIGSDPTLTLIADSGTNPMFHEAVTWYPPTDEVFFVQNAGARDAGTGLNKSAIIQKISLKEAMPLSHERNATGKVKVHVIPSQPAVINPNGATNYKGNLLFTGEGMGANIAPTLYAVNPVSPYNTTALLNNYFGRQFNSLNDVAINPRNQHIYFTDVTYGFYQDFRPTPGLPNQVYRLDPSTMAVTVVADDVNMCNGIAFSPNGHFAYVTDTAAGHGFYGYDNARPATIYRYVVARDGTFESRKVFAYASPGLADGVHTDSEGNVYSGCGDGVQVWNRFGTLLGKIFLGTPSANFQFAGDGRMVIGAGTFLYYATLAAKGAPIS